MSAQTDTDLATLAAALTSAGSALGKVQADVKADGTTLLAAQAAAAAAQSATAQKQAELAAALTEQGRLRALLVANNIDPSGTTPPPPPAQAAFGTFTFDPATGILRVPFVNVVATLIARTGTDSAGNGPFDTGMLPASFLAAANAAHAIGFSGMNVPGATFVITLDGTKGEHLSATWVAPGAPPPPPPGGKMKMGVFIGDDIAGSAATFSGIIGADCEVVSSYVDIRFPQTGGIEKPTTKTWLQAAPARRRFLLGINPMIGYPGDFENPDILVAIRNLCQFIHAQGIEDLILGRPCYEPNGDWMPWGRQYAGNADGSRFRPMVTKLVAEGRKWAPGMDWTICPIVGGGQPEPSIENFIPDGVFEMMTADRYNNFIYAGKDPQTRMNALLAENRGIAWAETYATAHGMLWGGIDEFANWNTTDGTDGTGDDGELAKLFYQWNISKKADHVVYFDSTQGGVGIDLGSEPNTRNALRLVAAAR